MVLPVHPADRRWLQLTEPALLFLGGVLAHYAMEVAAITGHETLVMRKRYTHLRAEDLAQKLG